ncbi:MAG: hypothetical protein AAF206_07325 [Bacteroidota bacterium]
MKTFPFNILIGLLLSGLLMACQDESPFISEVPEISLEGVSATQVKAFEDEISFTIRYTDGDGDLGTNDDSQRNVFVADSRIQAISEFRLQQVAPDGASVPVTGTFVLTLPNTIITNGASEESVVFTIYLVDRAGNESNRIDSPEIIVTE